MKNLNDFETILKIANATIDKRAAVTFLLDSGQALMEPFWCDHKDVPESVRTEAQKYYNAAHDIDRNNENIAIDCLNWVRENFYPPKATFSKECHYIEGAILKRQEKRWEW